MSGDLALARGDGSYPRLMRALGGVKLLILDDWGSSRSGPSFSLAELNRAIAELVVDLNARPMRRLGISIRFPNIPHSAVIPPSTNSRAPVT